MIGSCNCLLFFLPENHFLSSKNRIGDSSLSSLILTLLSLNFMVCIVDFDGTFFRNDFFKEVFFKKLIDHPFYILKHFFIYKKSLLELKCTLLSTINPKYPIEFLINPIVLSWINENKFSYSKIILVSASPDLFIKKILKDVNCFDEIHGSVNVNLKGVDKLEFIISNWGSVFDYVGDSRADYPIFSKSRKGFKITSKGLFNVQF